MKIKQEVFISIISKMPISPPEVGGIIGGNDGEVQIWEFDEGYKSRGCIYQPNVDCLNKVIDKWMDEGYEFMGILHVHFGGAKCLSEGDIRYIEKIMKSMPKTIKQLHFPIVVQPEGRIVAYVAKMDLEGKVDIKLEEVEVIIGTC